MKVKTINLQQTSEAQFSQSFVGCLVLTHDNKLLLQKRSQSCYNYPNYISTFGGKIETGETPDKALIRELHEELGAKAHPNEVIFLGAVTEAITNHSELIYEYFWHDVDGRITGCYEESPCYFDSAELLLAKNAKFMDDVQWVVQECLQRRLIL